jgi:hypothetical protein
LALLYILPCFIFVSFVISPKTLHRYQQTNFRAVESSAASTFTATSSSTYSTTSSYSEYDTATDVIPSKEESLETFVLQNDLFDGHSKVPNNEETFELENLGHIRCGGKKCFVRLKSNQQVGYLMAHEGAGFVEHIYKEFNQTWTLAKHLRQDYNVSTLLLEPPLEVLDKDILFLHQLNARLATDRKDERKNIRISTERPLVVQKVRVAPEPNMFWQMWWAQELSQDLKVYVHFLNASVTGDKRIFSRNLVGNFSVTRQILQDKEYSCLNTDLQFIIDYEGGIHHLDLDRCFEAPNHNDTNSRRQNRYLARRIRFINTLENCFKKALRALNVSSISIEDEAGNLSPSLGCK